VLSENEIISSADIRKELFQGDNIRMRNDPSGPEDEKTENAETEDANQGEGNQEKSESDENKDLMTSKGTIE